MWFKHPKYLKARSQFSKEISPSNLRYLHSSLPKIIFICGGDEKFCKNRGKIEQYIKRYHPDILTFRAEYAWNVISRHSKNNKTVNALSLEEWLADFSDVVIIIVESFGTVAELGAFSLSKPLRKKLLPILDKKYQKDESFLNTGPVHWVNIDSKYGPSIYTDFSTILTCMPDVESRLENKTKTYLLEDNRYGRYGYSKKVLLFFILYVVSSFGPVSDQEIVGIVKDVIDYKDKKMVSFILSIGVALGIFKETVFNEKSYFTCFDYDKLFRNDVTSKFLHGVQKSRARMLSNLITIPEFREVLGEVVDNAG